MSNKVTVFLNRKSNYFRKPCEYFPNLLLADEEIVTELFGERSTIQEPSLDSASRTTLEADFRSTFSDLMMDGYAYIQDFQKQKKIFVDHKHKMFATYPPEKLLKFVQVELFEGTLELQIRITELREQGYCRGYFQTFLEDFDDVSLREIDKAKKFKNIRELMERITSSRLKGAVVITVNFDSLEKANEIMEVLRDSGFTASVDDNKPTLGVWVDGRKLGLR